MVLPFHHLVKQMDGVPLLFVCFPVRNLTPTPKDVFGFQISPISSGYQVRNEDDGGTSNRHFNYLRLASLPPRPSGLLLPWI